MDSSRGTRGVAYRRIVDWDRDRIRLQAERAAHRAALSVRRRVESMGTNSARCAAVTSRTSARLATIICRGKRVIVMMFRVAAHKCPQDRGSAPATVGARTHGTIKSVGRYRAWNRDRN